MAALVRSLLGFFFMPFGVENGSLGDVEKRTGFDREQFFLCGIIFLHLDIKFAESKVIVRSESLAVVNEGLHVLVTVETFLLKDPGQLVFLRNNPADFLL